MSKSKCADQECPGEYCPSNYIITLMYQKYYFSVYDEIPGNPAVPHNPTEEPFCLKSNEAYGSVNSLSSPKSPGVWHI